jgi:hypothetical protein
LPDPASVLGLAHHEPGSVSDAEAMVSSACARLTSDSFATVWVLKTVLGCWPSYAIRFTPGHVTS